MQAIYTQQVHVMESATNDLSLEEKFLKDISFKLVSC